MVKLIQERKFFLPELTAITAGDELLNSFEIENINIISLLFQTGYLTIKELRRVGTLRQYILGFPNLEVEAALNNALMSIFQVEPQVKSSLQMAGYTALLEQDMEQFKAALHALFAAIPYTNYTGNSIAEYEGFYASVIYAWLASSQLPIIMEDCTNKGRIDLSVILDRLVYIIEFKVDQKGSALAQIKERNYAEKYMDNSRSIYLIGITFNSDKRNVSEFVWEKI